jgi:hypothetical protein
MQKLSLLRTLLHRPAGALLSLAPLLLIAQTKPAIAEQFCTPANICAPQLFGSPQPKPTSITVSWQVSGTLQPYILLMRGSTVMASQATKQPFGNAGTITATGLKPSTHYSGLALCSALSPTQPIACTQPDALFQATTTAVPTPPAVLDTPSLFIIKNNAFGIQFGWQTVHSYSMFNVRLGTAMPPEPINSGGTNGSWMFTSNGLPPGQVDGSNTPVLRIGATYALQVQGCGAGGNGCSGWGTFATTWNAKMQPGAWGHERQGVGVGTSKGPALAASNSVLYAAWKGVPGDNRMFWSTFNGANWSPERQGVGVGTSDGPSLALLNGVLYAAWKGVPGDTRMFWSTFDGKNWSPERQGVGTGTSNGPSLAACNGVLYAAWKGVPGDNRMFWSTFDGKNWSPERQGVGTGTSNGPSLAEYNGRIYAAWKGVPGDNRMFWSSFDGANWSPEQPGIGVGASEGPRLAVFNYHLFAAWKGVPNDTRMFWSIFDGDQWIGEWQGLGVGTSDGPSIAAFKGQLFAAWKGVPSDTRIFWSTFQ